MTRTSFVVAGFCALSALCAPAALAQTPPEHLKRFSLEDLVKLEVTSVSKREEKLTEAPSAIYVVTAEDIRRSGATTLPDVLRMVPGLQVAHIDANKWAISSRGFNGRFADKMLVLIDGRSVYTPLFSGVYWDVQDTVLEDIERIEIIRGPGATLWGANAVNGVINIITRSASDTVGPAASVTAGHGERAIFQSRYGARLGDTAAVRGFMKYSDRRPALGVNGAEAADGSQLTRGGFRLDWHASPDDSVMVEGDVYSGSAGLTFGPGEGVLPLFTSRIATSTTMDGAHLLGRWSRAVTSRTSVSLQAYFDRTSRTDLLLAEHRDTGDVDFHANTRLARRHNMVWGVGYRLTTDDLQPSVGVLSFRDNSHRDALFNVFVQDEVTIVPDRVRLTAGTKVEHNDYTGWEIQPDLRGVVLIARNQTVWAALSRAVRTPARFERDVRIDTVPLPGPGGMPIVASFLGNPLFRSETLRAHEVGYRIQPAARLSIDLAAFSNVYDHLRTSSAGTPELQMTDAGPRLFVPVIVGNDMNGRVRGVEAVVTVTPVPQWRLDSSYTHVKVRLADRSVTLPGLGGGRSEDDSPRHQARVHTAVTLASRFEIDGSVAYVSTLARSRMPAYTRADARFGWRVTPQLLLSAGVQNLRTEPAPEFASALGEVPTAARRGLFANASWAF